jgi:hypothetical protein
MHLAGIVGRQVRRLNSPAPLPNVSVSFYSNPQKGETDVRYAGWRGRTARRGLPV